jgi:hypothetical protein
LPEDLRVSDLICGCGKRWHQHRKIGPARNTAKPWDEHAYAADDLNDCGNGADGLTPLGEGFGYQPFKPFVLENVGDPGTGERCTQEQSNSPICVVCGHGNLLAFG